MDINEFISSEQKYFSTTDVAKMVKRSRKMLTLYGRMNGINSVRLLGGKNLRYYTKEQVYVLFPNLIKTTAKDYEKMVFIELPPKEQIFESKMNYDTN